MTDLKWIPLAAIFTVSAFVLSRAPITPDHMRAWARAAGWTWLVATLLLVVITLGGRGE